MPMPLEYVQKNQIWCGRSDLFKLLCTNRQGYDSDAVLQNSNYLFPDRGQETLSDSHFHLWPRTDVVFGLMICIEDPLDIPGFLMWCSKMEWKPIIAPEMYSQPNRTFLMLKYFQDLSYSLKYSHFATIQCATTNETEQVSQDILNVQGFNDWCAYMMNEIGSCSKQSDQTCLV